MVRAKRMLRFVTTICLLMLAAASILVARIEPASALTIKEAPVAKPAKASYKPEGTLTWGLHYNLTADMVDPCYADKSYIFIVGYALHDGLVKPMPEAAFAPSLAESWTVSPDGKTYEFKIRKGVKFHNGDTLTAEDVKFSFLRVKGINGPLLLKKVASVDVKDTYTVRFNLAEPWNDFFDKFAGLGASGAAWIVPKKYVEKVGDAEFMKKPVGAGPYKFVSFKPGVELVLEAFEGYWRKVPHVKTLVFKSITDGATNLAMLKRGVVDFASQMTGALGVEVEKDPKLRYVFAKAGSVVTFIPLDQFKKDSPWSHLKVRQAASLALDRQTIVDSTSRGAPLCGNFMPDGLQWAKTFSVDPYDAAKAKALLSEAGYPNGFDAGKLYGDSSYASTLDLVATYWNNVGIRIRTEGMERTRFYQMVSNNKFNNVIFDQTSEGNTAAARLDRALNIILGAYGKHGDIDALMKQQAVESNPDRRGQIVGQIQQLVHDRRMFIPVRNGGNPTGIGPRVKVDSTNRCYAPVYWQSPYEDLEIWPGK